MHVGGLAMKKAWQERRKAAGATPLHFVGTCLLTTSSRKGPLPPEHHHGLERPSRTREIRALLRRRVPSCTRYQSGRIRHAAEGRHEVCGREYHWYIRYPRVYLYRRVRERAGDERSLLVQPFTLCETCADLMDGAQWTGMRRRLGPVFLFMVSVDQWKDCIRVLTFSDS